MLAGRVISAPDGTMDVLRLLKVVLQASMAVFKLLTNEVRVLKEVLKASTAVLGVLETFG